MTGYQVQPNKAIVGANAFAHESGIHQDGVLKERTTYEIMDAATVGVETNSIVLGKHSGRHALRNALEELGFQVDGAALNTAFKRFKELADKKKKVTALDLEALVSDEMRESPTRLRARVVRGRGVVGPRAARQGRHALPGGEVVEGQFTGDGPVDAFFCDQRRARHEARLREFHVKRGDRRARRARRGLGDPRVPGRNATGQGVSTDILEASGRAYLRALTNALADSRSRGRSTTSTARRRGRRRPERRTPTSPDRLGAADPLRPRRARGRAAAAGGAGLRGLRAADHASARPEQAPALVEAAAVAVLHVHGGVPEAAAAGARQGRRAADRRRSAAAG